MSPATRCVLLGLLVFALATMATSPTYAQSTNANTAAAEALFNEGRELLQNGNVEQACERFSRSDQLDPAVGTELNLGECLERLGKVASAWLVYRRAVALADARADNRRAIRARAAAASLDARLPRLTIMVAAGAASTTAPPPGLVVTCNGARIEAAALRTPVPVDPGAQMIEASAPNHKPWRTTVDLAEGRSATVEIPKLETISSNGGDQAPTSSGGSDDEQRSSSQRTVGIGLEIGGGVVLTTGLILGALVIARWSSVEETCPNALCPNEAARKAQSSDADSARTLATASTIVTIAGALALAGGVVLHLTAPHQRSSASSAVTAVATTAVGIRPMVGASALGLSLTFDR